MREIQYCTKELKKITRHLRGLSAVPHDIVDMLPSLNFAVRKDFVYSAIIIRKMQEIHQLPQIDNYKIKVIRYPYINPNDPASQIMWAKDYDSANCVHETIELRKICNSLIHSYVYDVLYQRNKKARRMAYIGVASDYDKEKYVYVISIKDWIECLSYCSKIQPKEEIIYVAIC